MNSPQISTRKHHTCSCWVSLNRSTYYYMAIVDRYFRAISGNTQINAAEVRVMPLPDEETLVQIGEEVEQLAVKEFPIVEAVVGRALGLSTRLVKQLVEAVK